MTPEEQKRALDALRPRIRGACPNCGSKAWSLGGLAVSPEMNLITGDVSIGGTGIPMVSVVCNSCSLVHFFAAVPLGLVPPAQLVPSEKP